MVNPFDESLEAKTKLLSVSQHSKQMKIIESGHRSKLTDDRLEACLRLVVLSSTPDLHALLDNMQSHPFH